MLLLTNLWTLGGLFFWGAYQTPQKCNIHFSGWEVGPCVVLFKPPKKCNIQF